MLSFQTAGSVCQLDRHGGTRRRGKITYDSVTYDVFNVSFRGGILKPNNLYPDICSSVESVQMVQELEQHCSCLCPVATHKVKSNR